MGNGNFLMLEATEGLTPRIEVAPDILLRIRIISPTKMNKLSY